jgi:alanine dehydrogenase
MAPSPQAAGVPAKPAPIVLTKEALDTARNTEALTRLAKAINTYGGHVTYEAVAHDLGYDYVPLEDALSGKVAPKAAPAGKKAVART